MKRATCVKVALAMAVAVAVTLVGGPAFAQGKVIKMIPGGDLKIIDPIQNASYISRNHGYMVYDTLFGVADDFVPQPQMVGKYEISDDKKTYTFTLRDGLIESDGAPAPRPPQPTRASRIVLFSAACTWGNATPARAETAAAPMTVRNVHATVWGVTTNGSR